MVSTERSLNSDPAGTPATSSRLRRRRVGVSIGLAVLSASIYANSLANPFMYDDRSIIVEDARVQQGDWLALLTGRYWHLPSATRHYRPLIGLSYAINHALSPEPWGYRAANLILHAGTSVVLFLFALELFGSLYVAAAAGTFFAIHPVHTEALNAIVGRADLVVALGVLCAAWIYWRDSAPTATDGLRRPVAAATAFAVALLCKENAVTLLGVIVLLDWWRHKRGEAAPAPWLRRRALRAYLPMIVIVVAYLSAREVLLDSAQVAKPPGLRQIDNPILEPGLDLTEGDSARLARWATPLVTFGLASKLMLCPTGLCCDYSYAAIDTVKQLADTRLLGALAWMGLVGGGGVWSFSRRGRIAFALAFSLITYSIVSNLPVVIGTVFGERLLYLPSVGVCLCAGLAVGSCVDFLQHPVAVRRAVGFGGLAVFVAGAGWFTYLTVDRNRDWRSERDLWLAAERVNPRSCRVLNNRGEQCLIEGHTERALEYALRSIEVSPAYWGAQRTAALAYRRRGELDKAYDYFHKALDLGAAADESTVLGMVDLLAQRGETESAIRLIEAVPSKSPGWRMTRHQHAVLLVQAGRQEEARAILEALVRKHPLWVTPRFTFAKLLAESGAANEAVAHLEAVLQVQPGHRPARIKAAEYLRQAGRYEEAIIHLRTAVKEEPDTALLNNLAWWLITAEPKSLRNADEALVYSGQAAAGAPANSAVIDTHVAVLLAAGRPGEAADQLRSALEVIPTDDPLRPSFIRRLKELER